MREVTHNDRRRVINDVCNMLGLTWYMTKHFKLKFKHEADSYQICAPSVE